MLSTIKRNLFIVAMISIFWVFVPFIITSGEWFFLMLWVGIVGFVSIFVIKQIIDDIFDQLKVKEIITNGVSYAGTVIDYCDDWGTEINGVPWVDLVIQFTDNEGEKTMVFPTGTTQAQEFPIGMRIYIYKYNGEYAATSEYGKVPFKYKI